MNTTTTTVKYSTTTINYEDLLFMYFKNPVTIIRFYQIGYSFTLLLGFIGNTASLLTFSRPTLRKISTGCLFIALACSDILYLLMCIFDVLEFGGQIQFYQHVAYDGLCRFRVFITDVAQVASPWILVLVSLDRWIRTKFPFKSGSICTPKKALIAVAILLVIDIGLNSHILTPMFGGLAPGFAIVACGPSLYQTSYFLFYFLQWSIIQICIICLAPAIIMLMILIDIFISVRIRKRTVIRPIQARRADMNRQKILQRQMFILMFASICIFLITSLPVGIYKIQSPRQANIFNIVYEIITIWTGLGWLQSLFYAIGFYIHCLSSTLFRKEFKQQMSRICGKTETPVAVMTLTRTEHRIQSRQLSVEHPVQARQSSLDHRIQSRQLSVEHPVQTRQLSLGNRVQPRQSIKY